MVQQRKGRSAKKKPRAAADARTALVGRYLAVPTSFFNVEVEGARYLARVKEIIVEWRSQSSKGRYEHAMWAEAGLEWGAS